VTVYSGDLEQLVELLRAEPGFEHAELADAPQPLTGGFWATMSLLRLDGVTPPADTLVLRVMPDQALAAKETVFHREIARQGLPVPAIRMAGGASAGLGSAFLLMDHAPGRPPLDGLDGAAAIRRLPSLARSLPDLLGQVTAALHALDPTHVQAALAGASIDAPCDPLAFLTALAELADRLGRADLHAAARWLAGHPPTGGREVIAHGDLHPFNLLIDGNRWTLLDWTTALIADPAYDLAFTTFMLRHPPLTAPAPLRPLIRAAGAGLARRFIAAYQLAGGSVPHQQTLVWYTSLHALRILTELDGWRHEPARSDHASHPWTLVSPAAVAVLSRTTSIAIAPPHGTTIPRLPVDRDG
jgi:aminoglycoside phosphotransferase (APT) family kinase protein